MKDFHNLRINSKQLADENNIHYLIKGFLHVTEKVVNEITLIDIGQITHDTKIKLSLRSVHTDKHCIIHS